MPQDLMAKNSTARNAHVLDNPAAQLKKFNAQEKLTAGLS